MKSKHIIIIIILFLGIQLTTRNCFAWGTWGHRNITATAIKNLPLSMLTVFQSSSTFLQETTTDNGVRTGWSTHESDFHFINLGGVYTGSCQWPFDCMPQSVPSFLSTYGYSSLGFNGYVVDSLTLVLTNSYINWKNNRTGSNFTTAMVWMCRVAHYMEDLSQPLHVTWNYDANGVHSRYETNMLNTFQPTISTTLNGYSYQTNVLKYAFSMISTSYPYSFVINAMDTAAENAAGSTSNGAYYTFLWSSTQSFTTTLLNASAVSVATIWYTAWVNAGLEPVPVENWELYATESKRMEL